MDDVGKFNGCTFLVVGSNGSGKSTMLLKVFFEHVYVPNKTPTKKHYIVVLFTESIQGDTIRDVPKNVIICEGLNEDMLRWAYQMNEKYGKESYNFVFVLDDIIKIRYAQTLEKTMLVYRNMNITSIVSLQHANHIPKSVRGSAYFVLSLPSNSPTSIEVMRDNFLAPYLPGRTKRVQMHHYMLWACQYRSFFIDGYNHRAYKVDADYNTEELPIALESLGSSYLEEEEKGSGTESQ